MKTKIIKFKAFILMVASIIAILIISSIIAPSAFTNEEKPELMLIDDGQNVKNVILMICDGCGSNQILATDFYTDGKAGTQIYENFPIRLYMSTYSLGEIARGDDNNSVYSPILWAAFNLFKNNATDSAGAATAMSTGTKIYNAAVGIDQDGNILRHIAEDFEALGRSTGVVSTVQFSHATPASFVAHNIDRNNYSDIAIDMLINSATDVIMGTGHPLFDDNGNPISIPDYSYVGGQAAWDALVAGTLGNDADGDSVVDYWHLIQTKAEFEALQTGETPKRLIGVPQVHTTLQQARDKDKNADAYKVDFNNHVPTLAVMVKGALNVLDNNDSGFFLMIEGGAVDWACHENQSGRLIEELEDFNQAVEAVYDWVNKNSNWDETLLIVTSDHETGYLTGIAGIYGEVINNGKGVMPTMVWNSTEHTNQLVPFYAKGAGSEIFEKLTDKKDPIKGKYLDNTEISIVIRALIY